MAVIIKRLHELRPAQVRELAAFLDDAVNAQKAGWVCQGALRPGSFGDSYKAMLQAQSEVSALPSLNVDRWIALDGKKPIGVCSCSRGIPDRTITLFLVDPKLSPAEQLKVCDAIALAGIKDVLADKWGKGNFVSYLPNTGPAAVYAKLCGMEIVEAGPIVSKYVVGIKKMRDIILERQ